jgi:hypothetical protein
MMTIDRRQERRRNRISFRLLTAPAIEHIGPPLQADFARQRFARQFAHPRNLDVEGIERGKRAAFSRRREQRREITVTISSDRNQA